MKMKKSLQFENVIAPWNADGKNTYIEIHLLMNSRQGGRSPWGENTFYALSNLGLNAIHLMRIYYPFYNATKGRIAGFSVIFLIFI